MLTSLMPMATNSLTVVALAVRAGWLGFAVVEHRRRLVDWGMVFYRSTSMAKVGAAKRRVRSLIASFAPSLIAAEISEVAASRDAPASRTLVRFIRTEAHAKSIPFRSMSRESVRSAFSEFNARSKDEIAAVLAGLYPELRWKLPPRRRTWEKEHYRIALFDAIAVGIACTK